MLCRSFVLLLLLGALDSCRAFTPPACAHLHQTYAISICTHRETPPAAVKLASSNSGNGAGGTGVGDSMRISAASRARREEERRRNERRDEVVIGKTSAVPDATDFAIDPTGTEAQWKLQASDAEREINIQTDRGMQALKMLQLEEADRAFERVYQLKPDAYLWQAGVVKFYLGDLSGAADCFASNAATFERKFMSPASEERIWRDACELKIKSQMSRKDRKALDINAGAGAGEGVVSSAPPVNAMDESVSRETRKVIRIARELFKGSVENDHSAVALCRAKLRSICGESGSAPTLDRKMWKLSSWYYLGLHYDSLGDLHESKNCMKMALRQCASSGNGDDIVQILPMMHMAQRDWYDDDDFTPDLHTSTDTAETETDDVSYTWSASAEGKQKKDNSSGDGGARSVVKVSIMGSLEKMRIEELKASLKKRGLKMSGPKAELQQRLLDDLLRDAGF